MNSSLSGISKGFLRTFSIVAQTDFVRSEEYFRHLQKPAGYLKISTISFISHTGKHFLGQSTKTEVALFLKLLYKLLKSEQLLGSSDTCEQHVLKSPTGVKITVVVIF